MSRRQHDRALRLFVSFAPSDAELKDALLKHLTILHRIGEIDLWTVENIEPGDSWQDALDNSLGAADIALLLVSADSLASTFIQDIEFPRLLARHSTRGLHVIPVLLRTCAWHLHPWLRSLTLLPKTRRAIAAHEGDSRDQVLTEVVEELARLAGIPLTKAPSPADIERSVNSYAISRSSFQERAASWRSIHGISEYMQLELLPRVGNFPRMTLVALKELLSSSIVTLDPGYDFSFPWPFYWRSNQPGLVEAESAKEYPPALVCLHEGGGVIVQRSFSEDQRWPNQKLMLPGRLVREVAASVLFAGKVAGGLDVSSFDYDFTVVGANQRSMVGEVEHYRVTPAYGTASPSLSLRRILDLEMVEAEPRNVAAHLSAELLALFNFEQSRHFIEDVFLEMRGLI